MIVSKDLPASEPLLRLDNDAGPSSEPPPPSFEESAGHVLVEFDQPGALVPTGGEEAPPQFTPYNAEFWVSSDNSIISHDPHLNEDGEALFRFLLSQAQNPPPYTLRCRGTHVEHRTRLVSRTNNRGDRETRTEHYTETIVDFDFAIDVSAQVPARATQWTSGDEEPVYRGRMYREVGQSGMSTKADRATVKEFKKWLKEREQKGLPPWIGRVYSREEEGPNMRVPMREMTDVLKSSWSLRQWADDYCASPKILKEFVYEKVIYGWNIEALTSAVRSAILSTHYTGDIKISFDTSMAKVIVRPDTRLARALSNTWIKFFLIITLIYPFLWLFKRFHARGGGRWAVGGGAYALKRWDPVQPSEDESKLRGAVVGEDGVPRRLVGVREGEWFRYWEGTIRRMVLARKVDPTPVYGSDVNNWDAMALDGYNNNTNFT